MTSPSTERQAVATATPPRIAVVGSLGAGLTMWLRQMPGLGETVGGAAFRVAHGGKGSSQAVAAGAFVVSRPKVVPSLATRGEINHLLVGSTARIDP